MESQQVVVFVRFAARDLPGDDLAKDAVGVVAHGV
jgi:hypothetical protein